MCFFSAFQTVCVARMEGKWTRERKAKPVGEELGRYLIDVSQ